MYSYKLLLLLAVLILLSAQAFAVQVDGHCYLQGQTNHQGIKVLFEAASPSAERDSAYTNSDGYYTQDLEIGVYDVAFSHEGYLTQHLDNQLFSSATTLPDQTLTPYLEGIELSGNLSGFLQDTVYVVTGNISVDSYDALTIEAGAEFYFYGDSNTRYSFDVFGDITAVGTEEDSIKFLPMTGIESWGGMKIAGGSSASIQLEYISIQKGYTYGLYVQGIATTIRHSSITGTVTGEYWNGAVYSAGSSLTLEYCDICSNARNGMKTNSSSSVVTIRNCSVSYNGDNGLNLEDYGVTIDSCRFTGNGNHGVRRDNDPYGYTSISRCIFDLNGDQGIGFIDDGEDIVIDHCTFYRNSSGVSFSQSITFWYVAEITNCIFSPIEYGIIFPPLHDITLTYNDFYIEAGEHFTGVSPEHLGEIVTTNANGDSCDAFYNIYKKPRLVDPPNGVFYLNQSSPCIDAGDPNSPPDPDMTITDMGAYSFDPAFAIPEPIIELSAAALDFGLVAMGSSQALPLTIYNVGDTTLVLSEIATLNPVFTTDFNPADSLILADDELTINVSFAPEQGISYESLLRIDNNDETVWVQLTGEGSSAYTVTLTPDSPPIIIPETGGWFEYNIEIMNNSQDPQIFDLWCVIELPEVGSVEVINAADLQLPAYTSANRDRTQTVPEFAPAGTYNYYAFAGVYPWIVNDFDQFTFEKEGTDGGRYLGTPEDWICGGEAFMSKVSSPESVVPDYFALENYPNPFNPETVIGYQLPEASVVTLTVYDISGRKVAELVDGWRDAGVHEVTFDGSELASGIYIYRLTTSMNMLMGKMVLMK